MTTKLWPLAFKPASSRFLIRPLESRLTNPYTRVVQIQERDGARWEGKLTFKGNGRPMIQLAAFLTGLRGGVVPVLVPDFARLAATGSLAGSPQLVAGSGRSLSVTGFTPHAAGVLNAGDLIQTSPGRMHMVTADVAADADGAAMVTIEPRLREPVKIGPLVTEVVRVRMRLTADDAGAGQTSAPNATSLTVELYEVL